MKFIPDESSKAFDVPYLDDARKDDGWQGHTTRESVESLRAQISAEIGRLGGTVTRWMPGTYEIDGSKRPGIQLEYQVVGPAGSSFAGRIDVAGLPWKEPYGGNRNHGGYKQAEENQRKKSLAMALYNVREALKAMRILQVLSPGYAALLPWLLADETGKTIGEMWGIGSPALPAPSEDGDVIDMPFKVIESEK